MPMVHLLLGLLLLRHHVLAASHFADSLGVDTAEFSQEISNSLLQHVAARKPPAFSSGPSQLLKEVAPLKFMHTPKCGSSFSNVIAHSPGVCPELPSTVALDFDNFGQFFDVEFWILCPEICNTKMLSCNPPMYKHELFGEDLINPYRGHLVTMVRDPVQRIAASYNDPVFDFVNDVSEPGTRYRKTDSSGNPLPHTIAFDEFAINWTGMVTTQLTRTDWTVSWHGIYLSDKDAQEAARRLRKDFVFVGIVEQWELSMCLFRTMFGGNCIQSDFMDTRPGFKGRSGETKYDTGNFHDAIDEVVYHAALEIFESNLLKYNVTETNCQPCYKAAGLS